MSDENPTPTSADAPPANLIAAFIACRPGATLAAVCGELNGALDSNYGPKRLLDWRRGDRTVPEAVQRYMRAVVLHSRMPTRESAEEWSRMLEPPPLRQRPERLESRGEPV